MLTVAHLNVRYGATEVLRDVSFAVPDGRIVALLGGNGSGKTTILNTLTGLLKPRAGSISVAGVEVAGWTADLAGAPRRGSGAAGARGVRGDDGGGEP